jgi:hypothetical protein
MAVEIDPRRSQEIPSSKGVLWLKSQSMGFRIIVKP